MQSARGNKRITFAKRSALFVLLLLFPITMSSSLSSFSNNNAKSGMDTSTSGKLEKLKQREAELAKLLAEVRLEKLQVLRDRPLRIGIMGFGRFGQFIAKSFAKYGEIVGTSRSDYTEIATEMGAKFIPLSDPGSFLNEELDVIVLAVSILSFDDTVKAWAFYLEEYLREQKAKGNSAAPLIVDVCSVKEHPRNILLEYLPKECDILCTHPMFGPDSGKEGWKGLIFVYERTRINGVVLDPNDHHDFHQLSKSATDSDTLESFLDKSGHKHYLHEDNEGFVEAIDRIERFLSIWEEEGCRMIPMSCKQHDDFASRSQFITHLMGRILAKQGLIPTPIDTKGFQSVLKLIESTSADSFDLFYGLYKYNQNSQDTIKDLQNAMEEVVSNLKSLEKEDQSKSPTWVKRTTITLDKINQINLDEYNANNKIPADQSVDIKVMSLKLDETDPDGVSKTKI